MMLELLGTIVAANHQHDKREALSQMRITIEQVRLHTRLAFDLKILGKPVPGGEAKRDLWRGIWANRRGSPLVT